MLPTALVPDWPAPPWVQALCTTRAGGVSRAPFDSLNLGDHVGDDPLAVLANRRGLSTAIAARPIFLQQVHGVRAVMLDEATPDGTVADACLTRTPGLACTIMVADCLPVLFCNRAGTTVAAAHAGWRGLAGSGGQGVLEQALAAFLAAAAVDPADIGAQTMVWLGPCIGPQAFEVGPDVKDQFQAHDPSAAEHFRPLTGGKWLADLAGLARQRLAALGITSIYGNDASAGWCTVSQPSRFFSHRRDGRSGRFAACVWLR